MFWCTLVLFTAQTDASTLNLSSGTMDEEKQKDERLSASDALRQAAQEYADACNFENARSKIEEDIALCQSFDRHRLPESWLILGNIYRLEGVYPESLVWLTRAVSALEKQKPPDKKILSAAYYHLCLLNNNRGDFSESEKNARLALALSLKAELGKSNEALQRIALASALRQGGRYKEALNEMEIAMPILKEGNDKKLLSLATTNLGVIKLMIGDAEQAMPLLKDGLRLRIEASGEDHPDVAAAYLDLGLAEFKLGETDSAIENLTQAREIRLDKLGANHPETLNAEANLGAVLLAAGDGKAALELLKDAVERGKNILGANSPDLAQYDDFFANALAQDKQFEAARNAEMNSLVKRKNIFGSASREYAAGLRSLARIESYSGNSKECRALLLKSIAIYNALEQHPDLDWAETLDELASNYASSNELEIARQTFVLAIREKLKTGNTISYATSLIHLAELLGRMNNALESTVMLQKAAAAIEALPDAEKKKPDARALLDKCKQFAAKTKSFQNIQREGNAERKLAMERK